MATITKRGDVLEIATPYNQDFVNALKAKVPYSDRSWQKPHWVVSSKHLAEMEVLAKTHFGYVDVIYDKLQSKAQRLTLVIDYLGRCKDDGYANLSVGNVWAYRVSDETLKAYFEQSQLPEQPQTLYALLGVQSTDSLEAIKRGYFRAAKVWHPDLNKDADAGEMFKRVKQAYDLLADPLKRTKYDVGLKFQQRQAQPSQSWINKHTLPSDSGGYRAPAACGILDCDVELGIKNTITKIYSFADDVKTVGGLKLIRVAYIEKSKGDWGDRERIEIKQKWEKLP